MPIERAFCRFPEFTDFGEFAIVNSNASSPESTGHLLDTFRRILADKHRIIYPIIATETILNPFNDKGDITERFAIFSAALTETGAIERRETYTTAKRLYGLRCQAVHRSQFSPGPDTMGEDTNIALQLFLRCLKAIVAWASVRLEKQEPCDGKSFADLYRNSVFA